ncbi:MAG: hypothetical protein QMD06_00245 [Candidatus Altarchaeum sp.]|nr:hypothetical protein [Candidatus Altarchaeum sp.]
MILNKRKVNVYLISETNFLVDAGMDQDNNVRYIVRLALDGKIKIIIPEISFFDVWETILSKIKRIKELAENLRKEANQISRSICRKNCKEFKRKCKIT